MSRYVRMTALWLLLPATIFAQTNDVWDGDYSARKPVPYYHLREADVMWSKKVLRMVDLREKINLPLYYPTTPMDGRYSLISLLLLGIEKEEFQVYDPTMGDEFTVSMTPEMIDMKLGATTTMVPIEDPVTGDWDTIPVKSERKTDEVQRLMIKETWFFDKQRAKMEVRIVGLCPIRVYTRSSDSDYGTVSGGVNQSVTTESGNSEEPAELEMKQVFWAYYPSVRSLLASYDVFNPYSDNERRSFDEIFAKRRFSSYIFQESNVYNNRNIGEYKLGLDALLEAERVKNFMANVEHDLWEF